MEQKSMTALISAYARAYHAETNEVKIFNDSIARQLLTNEEYSSISDSMIKGIKFFNPSFTGTESEALKWIVDNQLSPVPLGRAVFAEKSLETAVRFGAGQYLILAAGYDTFAYRQPVWAAGMQIIEIDMSPTAADKRERLTRAGISIPDNVTYISADLTEGTWEAALADSKKFSKKETAFCSMLGLSYYLSKQTFEKILSTLGTLLPRNSTIVFDYPVKDSLAARAGTRAKKHAMLTEAAGENMLSSYSYVEMERLLSDCGFLIYEHLTPPEMTEQYFKKYNEANPSHTMTAFDNVSYCLAVNYASL